MKRNVKQPVQSSNVLRNTKYIRASRSSLIDYIDENYNTEDNYEELNSALTKLFNIDVDTLDDSDLDEGMYAHLSDEQLKQLKDYLDNPRDQSLQSYSFTSEEVSVLIEAMQNFSEPSFTKDRKMSAVARKILKKLSNNS